jgi:hypothetical protein
MSISNDPHSTNPSDLQFDQAEYTLDSPAAQPEATSCAACKRPIEEVYFEAGGKILCASCRDKIQAFGQRGGGVTRVLKALVFGSIGAAVGALLYYAIMRITGYNIGLVAVVVGVLVGGAVRAGSENRGGRFYQLLAVFLTYSAIAAMYVPEMLAVIQKGLEQDGGVEVADADGKQWAPEKAKPDAERKKEAPAEKHQPNAAKKDEALSAKPAAPAPVTKPAAPTPAAPRERVAIGGFMFAAAMVIVLMVGFAYSIPVLVAFQAPISGLIFCFAIWEAWKINRRVQIAFNGPFRLAAPEAPELKIDPQEAGNES